MSGHDARDVTCKPACGRTGHGPELHVVEDHPGIRAVRGGQAQGQVVPRPDVIGFEKGRPPAARDRQAQRQGGGQTVVAAVRMGEDAHAGIPCGKVLRHGQGIRP